MEVDGRNRLGNPDGQNAPLMQGLPQSGVVETEVTGDRMNLSLRSTSHPVDGALDLVDQRQPVASITRITLGHEVGKDQPGGGFRDNAGLAAKLCRAIAFALDNGSHGEIVGVDHLSVLEFLALGEPFGLLTDVLIVTQGRSEGMGEPLPLGFAEPCRLLQAFLDLLGERGDGLTQLQELAFGLAHELDEHVPLTATAAAKAPHDFFEFLPQIFDVALKGSGAATALLGDVIDEV